MIAKSTSIGLSLAAALAAPALLAAAPMHRAAPMPAHMTPRFNVPSTLLEVGTGRGRLVTLAQPMSDLFVANDTVADVQVRSPTQLYVFGKKTGETTISATSKSGQVVYAATVRVGNNIDSMQSMLALAMPDAHVVATPMNGLVLLTGTVAAPADAAEAERLIQAYVGTDTKVLSRLKSATPLQVMLQVRIAEVSRNFAKNIGANLQNRHISNGVITSITSGRQGTITTQTGNPVAGYVNGAPVDAQGNAIAVTATGALPGSTLFGFPANTASGPLWASPGTRWAWTCSARSTSARRSARSRRSPTPT